MIAMKIEKAKSVSEMNYKGGFEYRGGTDPVIYKPRYSLAITT